MRLADIREKWFTPKTVLLEPGTDPTLERLRPVGDLGRGRGGLGEWGLTLFLALAFVGILAWGFRGKLFPAKAAQAAPPTAPATLAASGGAGADAALVPTRRPTRTPLVWPTLGVITATPREGAAVVVTATPSTVPTLIGDFVATDLPTAAPPTWTAVVIYRDGGSRPGPTQIVVVTAPPAATYTPLPTYTPMPTYTQPPTATPTVTYTPTPTATCPPPTAAPTVASGDAALPYVLYLPLVSAGGNGGGQTC